MIVLRPVNNAPKPHYPEGPPWLRGLIRWTRRVLVTAGAVAAFGLVGCYGATRSDRPEPEPEPEPPLPMPCEHEQRMSGFAMPANYFTCSDSEPDSPPHELTVHLGTGQLCGDELSLSWFELTEPGTLRFGLSDWSEAILLSVLDSEGRALATIGPGSSCAELELEAGELGLFAEAVREDVDDFAFFEFYIDRVGEED